MMYNLVQKITNVIRERQLPAKAPFLSFHFVDLKIEKVKKKKLKHFFWQSKTFCLLCRRRLAKFEIICEKLRFQPNTSCYMGGTTWDVVETV